MEALRRPGSWPVLAIIAVGVALRAGLVGLDPDWAARHGPVVDDTYYYLGIARNLLQGHGATHDGLHPTAGFHPVWMAVVTIAVAVGGDDPYRPVFLLVWGQVVLSVVTGLAIHRVAVRVAGPRGALYALTAWSVFPPFVCESVNGLETGLACLAVVVGLRAHLAWVESSRGVLDPLRSSLVGLLYGMVILCRLDLGLFIAVLGARWLHLRCGRSWMSLALATVAGLLVVAPWFAFVHHQTGGFLPESGSATRTLALAYGTRPGSHDTRYVDFDSPAPEFFEAQVLATVRETLTRPAWWPVSVLTTAIRETVGVLGGVRGLATLGGILSLAWFAWRWWRRGRERRTDPTPMVGPLVLAASLLFVSAYSFFVFGSWWFGRYYTPMMTLWVLYSALPVQRGFSALERRVGPAGARIALVLLVSGAVTFGVVGREASLGPLNPTDPYWRIAETAGRLLPSGTRLGSFQSGTIGWASRHTVVNLDGVVNRGASRAIREGRVLQYALDQGVDCIVDWPWVLRDLLFRRSVSDPSIRLRPVFRGTMDLYCIERLPVRDPVPE